MIECLFFCFKNLPIPNEREEKWNIYEIFQTQKNKERGDWGSILQCMEGHATWETGNA